MEERIPYVDRLREELLSAIRKLPPVGVRPRRYLVGVFVALLLAAGVGLPLAALSFLQSPGRSAPSSLSTTQGLSGGIGALTGQPVVTATIQLDRGLIDITTGYGSVWAITYTGVARIDAATNAVVATIPVEVEESSGIAAGEGAVWVTYVRGEVTRIDPTTNTVVASIPVKGAWPLTGIAVGGGSVWVARLGAGDGTVVRIDPQTNEVVGAPIPVGAGPAHVAYVAGFVWVTNTADGSVSRIDPRTGQVTASGGIVRMGGPPEPGSGPVWALSNDSVLTLDPASNMVLASLPIPRPDEVVFSEGGVWILTTTGSTDPNFYIPDPDQPATVVLLDAQAGRLVGTPVPVGNSPAHLAVGEGAAWVANYDSGVVTRIELSAEQG